MLSLYYAYLQLFRICYTAKAVPSDYILFRYGLCFVLFFIWLFFFMLRLA